MALNDLSTTWTGIDADGFYSLAVLTGDSKQYFRQMANVKHKKKVASLQLSGSILQAGDGCTISESGDHTIDDVTVEVCDFAINLPLCTADYEDMYLSETLKPGSNVEQNFPAGLVDYIKNQIQEEVNADVEYITWQGDTAASPPDLCDGILKKLLADVSVVDVASPLTLSESNIVSELTRIVKLIPKIVRSKKQKNKIKIFMSVNAGTYLELGLYAATPAIYAYNRDEMKLQFAGYECIVSPGLPNSTIVVCDPDNLIFATDLAADEKTLEFKQNPLPGKERQYNFIGYFKMGFQIVRGSEILLYGGAA